MYRLHQDFCYIRLHSNMFFNGQRHILVTEVGSSTVIYSVCRRSRSCVSRVSAGRTWPIYGDVADPGDTSRAPNTIGIWQSYLGAKLDYCPLEQFLKNHNGGTTTRREWRPGGATSLEPRDCRSYHSHNVLLTPLSPNILVTYWHAKAHVTLLQSVVSGEHGGWTSMEVC